MKKVLLILGICVLWIFCSSGVAFADMKITFGWDANTEQDLAWYKLYGANTSGGYDIVIEADQDGNDRVINSSGELATILAGTEEVEIPVGDGDWYFVLTAGDIIGNESMPSGEISTVVDSTAPAKPERFKILKKILAWLRERHKPGA